MPKVDLENLNLYLLEDTIWIATKKIHVSRYDFPFETFFACRSPYYRPEQINVIGRFGVSDNYSELFLTLQNEGISLIHTPTQYALASELTHWYPILEDITPRSLWFEKPPVPEEVERHFSYPVFIKGSRQTSKHKADLSIVRSRREYEIAILEYQNNPILHWQSFVCREYIALRKVDIKHHTDKITPSFEFRTFWWRGEHVGSGAYWADFASYAWTKSEKLAALYVAQKAAERLDVIFLVVDVAQTQTGDWIVIECNDAQESGYAAVAPISLWQNIIDIERRRLNSVQNS